MDNMLKWRKRTKIWGRPSVCELGSTSHSHAKKKRGPSSRISLIFLSSRLSDWQYLVTFSPFSCIVNMSGKGVVIGVYLDYICKWTYEIKWNCFSLFSLFFSLFFIDRVHTLVIIDIFWASFSINCIKSNLFHIFLISNLDSSILGSINWS